MIREKTYRTILSLIPLVCVDLLIRKDGKTLLLKRRNPPLKGKWWIVGGRLCIGEDPIAGAKRKALEEVGLKLSRPKFVGYYSAIYKSGPFGAGRYQTISLVFACSASGEVKLDSQSSSYKWSEALPAQFRKKFVGCGSAFDTGSERRRSKVKAARR